MTQQNSELLQQIAGLNLFSIKEIKNFICNTTKTDENDYYTDNLGNIIYSENSEADTMIIFRITPTGVIVDKTKDNKAYVNVVGNVEAEKLNGKETTIGTIKIEEKKLYINLNEEIDAKKSSVIGVKSDLMCEGELLYGIDLKNIIPLYLVAELISKKTKDVKGIYFAVVNESISGKNGFIEVVKRYKPKKVIFISVVKEQETCKTGKGPAIVIKDGNCVVPKNVYSAIGCAAEKLDLSDQFFVGKTDNVLEKISIAEKNLCCGGVYLPIKQSDNGMQKIIFRDVEKTLNLLLKIIAII